MKSSTNLQERLSFRGTSSDGNRVCTAGLGCSGGFGGLGDSGTVETESYTITKSSDVATLPQARERIRFTVTLTPTMPVDNQYFRFEKFEDTYDPAQLLFNSARIQYSTANLQYERRTSIWPLNINLANVAAAEYFQGLLDAGPWDEERTTEAREYVQDRIDELDALIAGTADEDLVQQYHCQQSGWQQAGDAIFWTPEEDMVRSVTQFIEGTQSEDFIDKTQTLQAFFDDYSGYITQAIAAGGTLFVPAVAEVEGGFLSITPRSPSGYASPFPRGPLVVEYDMEYLGGDEVTNQACPIFATTEIRMGNWTPPQVTDDDSAAVALAAIEADPGCVNLTLGPPETTVHVAKQVRAVGATEFVTTPQWQFERGVGDALESGTTAADGYEWLLPLSNSARDVRLREVSAPTALLSDYDLVSVTCTDAGLAIPATLDPATRSAVLPALPPGSDVSCVFQNQQRGGTATWQKHDNTGKALGGAVFEISGPSGSIRVEDCLADNCAGPDTDPRPGHFAVANLPWAEHSLKEITAPAGYTASNDKHTFAFGSGKLTADVGIFVNNPVPAATTPPPPVVKDPPPPVVKDPPPALAESGANPATLPVAGTALSLAGLGTWLLTRSRRRTD